MVHIRRARHSAGLAALATVVCAALAPLGASAAANDTGGILNPVDGTVIQEPGAIAGPDQELGWTTAQVQQHDLKLGMLASVEANDPNAELNILGQYGRCTTVQSVRVCGASDLSTTTTTASNCGPDGCPPSSASINEDGAIEPDGYCGPTSAHNVLWAFGLNDDIYTIANAMGQYNNQGVGRGGWDSAHHRWWGEAAINDFSGSHNGYEWSTANAASDLWYFTQSDIWAGVGPIYNIQSYGWDPQTQSYRYPLPQYPASYNGGSAIRHYLPAFGYKPTYDLQVFDENNYLSNHYWDVNAGDMWAAAYMNFNNGAAPQTDAKGNTVPGATPQVLW